MTAISLTHQRDQQARDLNRQLSIIAVQAREMALDDGTSSEGAAALRGIAEGVRAIASQAGVICHANAGNDLASLAETIDDICAAIVRAQHTPTLSMQELAGVRLDERSKASREDAA